MTSHDRPGAEAFSEDDERQMLDVIERWLERNVRPNVLEHAEPIRARDLEIKHLQTHGPHSLDRPSRSTRQ